MGNKSGSLGRFLSVILPVFTALVCAGASSQCAGQQIMGLCDSGLATVLIDNRSVHELFVVIHNDAGARVYDGRVAPSTTESEMTPLPIALVPFGHVTITALDELAGENLIAAPSELTLICGSMQTVIIEGSEPAPTPLPVLDVGSEHTGFDLPHLEIDACIIDPPRPLADLMDYIDFSSSALGQRILANKAYLEDFFATTFPDLYAEAGGEAINVEIVTAPGTVYDSSDTHIELLTDLRFTVAPQFRFLNARLAEAGQFSLAKQWYTEGGAPIRSVAFQAYPATRRGSPAFMSWEFQLPTSDLSAPSFNELDYIRYEAPIGDGMEYQLAFLKAPCHGEEQGPMVPFYRWRLRAGSIAPADERINPFVAWRVINPHLGDCLLKAMNKTLRGQRDFIRRKLLDLGGNDSFIFERDAEGSGYTLSYNGTYECSSLILGSLIDEL